MARYTRHIRIIALLTTILMAGMPFISEKQAFAASAAEIDRDVDAALKTLLAKSASARELFEKAKAVLVFPSITKAGLIAGGQYGEGALRKNGRTVGYYSTVAASFGLQLGVQRFGYALFFMTNSALKWLDKSDGWEIGTGPSVVIVDVGAAGALTTTTARSEIYAFFFSQKGLMAGLGLQGTKITRIEKQ
jgi:lipid-binding SYLF domain-containing protein